MSKVKNLHPAGPGFKLFYTDTDSAHINMPLLDHMVSNTELGKFKLERVCNKAIYLAPKVYGLQEVSGKDIDRIQHDTLMWSEYERIRHPPDAGGRGESIAEFVFDCLPYLDTLMEDLGLKSRRKKTLFDEWFTPYSKTDYEGIVEEWIETVAKCEGN